MRFILTLFFIGQLALLFSQELATPIFKDTRIINAASVETLPGKKIDIRIGHRFGDLIGDAGGWPTFYGLESARDVLIGFDIGLSPKFMVGVNRTKGNGPLKQLINTSLKYKLITQKENSTPISLSAYSIVSISTMQSSTNPDAINFFEAFAHRMVYTAQLIAAKKFSNGFSLQIAPTYTHRNIVEFDDTNGIISLGMASRIQLTKVFGIIVDATYPFSDFRSSENGFYPSLGVGLEIDTGGHRFQINFTNSKAMSENDYIPYTTSNWGDSQFRLGFTISRLFNY